LKRNKVLLALAGVFAIAGSALISVPAQSATPSILVWVDSPRLPGAKEYAKIMKGSQCKG